MSISINGIGVTGGFGCGIDTLKESLENSSVSRLPVSDSYYTAFTADTSSLAGMVPKRALRRIDHFSRLALTGACLAVNDAGLDSLDRHSTGLVICSGYGSAKTTFSFLDSIIDFGDNCASPTLFSNSVHNAAAGHISILMGLEGPCLTVSQFEMSVPSALLTAIQWLKEERVEQVLFGAVDEYCDVVGYCYQRYYGRRENMVMAPLVSNEQSAIPGEGSVFFLLSLKKQNKYYGLINAVQTGSITDIDKKLPEDTFFIVNADGHKETDIYYADLLPPGSSIACYTPLYGSVPTGSAFDMAVAALSLRQGKLFSSNDSVGDRARYRLLRQNSTVESKNISCLKIGRDGKFSIITMSDNI